MSPKKRRYVGNANAKKRQEVEGTFGTQLHYRRALDHLDQTLPSPEKIKPKEHVKVQPMPTKSTSRSIQDILTQNIIRYQHQTKTFKTEDWYSSPAGYGAVSNAIIAALATKDNARTGFISVDDIVDAFTKINFGLCEEQVRQLIAETHANPEMDKVHYKSFAKQFDLPPSKSEDPITRKEKHVALLRENLNQPSRIPVPSAIGKRRLLRTPLHLDKIHPLPPTTKASPLLEDETQPKEIDPIAAKSPRQLNFEFSTKLPSPTRYSAKCAKGVIPQTATTFELGGDMRNTPNSIRRSKLLPQVIDQNKKESRRKAKQELLSNHLQRIEAYAALEDYKAKLYEENHIKATTAKHLAYNQAFLEQSMQVSSKEHQKGLLYSTIAQKNHNVSTQSMFSHPPHTNT